MQVFDATTGFNTKSGYCSKEILSEYPEIVFKASYIILSDLVCAGRIEAHFDLVVIGDLSADELDIKGRFVCLGKCAVKSKITVGGSIVANEIITEVLETQETVTARELDVKQVKAKGQIVICGTLSVEELAQSVNGSILCGETIYGCGKAKAKTILTAEEPDLDGGINVRTTPYSVGGQVTPAKPTQPTNVVSAEPLGQKIKGLIAKGDFRAVTEVLAKNSNAVEAKRISSGLRMLQAAQDELIAKKPNLITFLRLQEISTDECFAGATTIENVLNKYKHLIMPPKEEKPFNVSAVRVGYTAVHAVYKNGVVTEVDGSRVTIRFQNGEAKIFMFPAALPHLTIAIPETKQEAPMFDHIKFEIATYADFIEAISLLQKYGKKLSQDLFCFAFEAAYSKIGVKAYYLDKEFATRGWRKYGN